MFKEELVKFTMFVYKYFEMFTHNRAMFIHWELNIICKQIFTNVNMQHFHVNKIRFYVNISEPNIQV